MLVREATVHQSMTGDLALRRGPWKQIFFKDGRRELYNMQLDLSELQDVHPDNPQVAEQLTQTMQAYIDRGRSTPGPDQQNDAKLSLAAKSPAKTKKATKKQSVNDL
jgi:hypothetical protein